MAGLLDEYLDPGLDQQAGLVNGYAQSMVLTTAHSRERVRLLEAAEPDTV